MSLEQKKINLLQFKGILCPTFTPFNQQGEVDVSQISGYCKYLKDNKVEGIYVCGTTGEGLSLTKDERIRIAKAWHKANDEHKANLLVVFHVTSNCMLEAVEVAKEVEKLGFGGIALLPPNYYKPQTIEDWVEYVKVIARAAPNTPILYYHNVIRIGELNFDIIDAIGEGLKQIPQLTAMKFSDYNVMRLSILQQKYGKELKIFAGSNESLLAALLSVKCDAGLSSLLNLENAMNAYRNMFKYVAQSDLDSARKEQDKVLEECAKHKATGNFLESIKTEFNNQVKSRGINVGYPRPPISFHYKI